MPRKDQMKRAMESYLEVVKATRAGKTFRVYSRILANLHKIVKRQGISTYVSRWTVKEFSQLMANRGHLLPNSFNQEIVILRNLLRSVGNMEIDLAFKDGTLRRKPKSRVNVRWFTETQLAYIRANCRRDMEYLILILGSEIGLRRSEIADLRVSDIKGDVLIVRGKGEKMTPVPITTSLRETLDAWLLIRQDMIKKALRINPTAQIPDNMLVYRRGKIVSCYSPDSISNIIRKLGKQIGMKISPHDLRRSCGREIYKTTRDIVAVNRLLRHANLDQTKEYIGADLEDAREAMETRERSRTLTVPKTTYPVFQTR
jgi:integrase